MQLGNPANQKAPVQASNDRILLAQEDLQALRMGVEPFLPVACKNAGRLWPLTLEQTLPLADRDRLSLGLLLSLMVVACDRAWSQLILGQDIELKC